jgi:hypothetical protein
MLKDLRQAPKALLKFVKLIDPVLLKVTASEAVMTAALPSRSSLLRARIRLDVVCMLLQRCVHVDILVRGAAKSYSYHLAADAMEADGIVCNMDRPVQHGAW